MKKEKTQLLFSLFCVFIWCGSASFSQSIENLKIEKRLYKLYYEKGNLKKCNRVSKRYINRSEQDDKGLNTACYYAALSYIYYPEWNWKRWMIFPRDSYITSTHPLNYIDSALKYNDLFLEGLNTGSITKNTWQEEFFSRIDFEVKYVWANQLFVHGYPEYNQNPELIYANHKEQCDSILRWELKLYQLAKEYYPEKSLEKYLDYQEDKNSFLGLNLSIGQLDTIYDQFDSYMLLNDNVQFYSSKLPDIIKIDTAQFYRFLHLIEAYDTTYTQSDYYDWKITTSGFGYDKKYITIWEPLERESDAGTFLITDSVRTNKLGYTYTYSIPFRYDLYPGDTMRFHRIEDKDVVITNLQYLQKLNGAGTAEIIVRFTDPSAHTFPEEWEWDKREKEFLIKTSRGKYKFKVVYRYKYVE